MTTSESKCFGLVGDQERHLPFPVALISWNPSADLLAILSARGDLVLQRLFWKKAWQVSVDVGGGKSEAEVTAMCWSPDGKCLVLADSTGRLRFFDAENGVQIDSSSFVDGEKPINYLDWIAAWAGKARRCYGKEEDEQMVLAELPLLPDENETDSVAAAPDAAGSRHGCLTFIDMQRSGGLLKKPSFLVQASPDGTVTFVINGLLPLFTVNLGRSAERSATTPLMFSHVVVVERKYVAVALEDSGGAVLLSSVELDSVLSDDHSSIWRLADRFASVQRCRYYLDAVLAQLKVCWEDLLVEIDIKFSKYAKDKFLLDGGSVGDDLLILLVLGNASSSLEEFLLHSLGDRGLKKVFRLLDQSYKQLLELTSSNLQTCVTNLTFHLAQLKSHFEYSSEIHLALQKAICISGQLALKLVELREVISVSGSQLRSFFRWLNKALSRLSAEPQNIEEEEPCAADEAAEQVDTVIHFIRDTFMKCWSEGELGDEEAAENGPLFRLERVGQYLEQGPLSLPRKAQCDDECWWRKFERDLNETNHLHVRHDGEASLFDLIERLKLAVVEAEQIFKTHYSSKAKVVSAAMENPASNPAEQIGLTKIIFSRKLYKGEEFANGKTQDVVQFCCSRANGGNFSVGLFNLASLVVTFTRDIDLTGTFHYKMPDFGVTETEVFFVLLANNGVDCYLCRQKLNEVFQGKSLAIPHKQGKWQLISSSSNDRVCQLIINEPRNLAAAVNVTKYGIRLFDLNPDDDAMNSSVCSSRANQSLV